MVDFRVSVIITSAVALAACQPSEVSRDMSNCERLTIGMSVEDVIAVMGPPRLSHDPKFPDRKILFFSYSDPILASGPITIWFENPGGGYRVSKLECNGQM